MNDGVLLAGFFMLLVIQLFCFASKTVVVRLLPVLTVAAGMMLCLILYAWSGFTNWAYLIIMALIFFVLGILGIMWLIYGIYRGAKSHRNG